MPKFGYRDYAVTVSENNILYLAGGIYTCESRSKEFWCCETFPSSSVQYHLIKGPAVSNKFWKYDADLNKWQELPPMSSPRCKFSEYCLINNDYQGVRKHAMTQFCEEHSKKKL